MANNYYQCTPKQPLTSTKEEEADKLFDLLDLDNDDLFHGYMAEYYEDRKEFYMYCEEGGDECDLPEEFLKELGKLIKKNKLDYLEFGYCWYCSKMRAGEFGGGKFRITTDGEIKYPKEVWED